MVRVRGGFSIYNIGDTSLNMSLSLLVLITLFMGSLVSANIKFSDLSSSYSVSQTITVKFKDDGDDPKVSTMLSTTILMCTGSNSDIHCFDGVPLGTGVKLSSLDGVFTAALSTIAAVGNNGPYFLQFYSTLSSGGSNIIYTDRFNMTSMTGTYKATSDGDTDPPDGSTSGTDDAGDISSLVAITYTKQTGKTRYAPMQTQPGTKVTRSLTMSRRYPTSAVSSYYKSYHAKPAQITTVTPGWSYTFSAWTNYATANADPTGYYAATATTNAKITKATATSTKGKKKRWED